MYDADGGAGVSVIDYDKLLLLLLLLITTERYGLILVLASQLATLSVDSLVRSTLDGNS